MTLRLYAVNWEENNTYPSRYPLGDESAWWIDLVNGDEAGVTSFTTDSNIQKRFTSYKYVKEGRDTVTGLGGAKVDHRQVRFKDRKREDMDIQIQGWFSGETTAQVLASKLDYYSKRNNTVLLMATDEMVWWAGYMGAEASNIISDGSDDTDWKAGEAGSTSAGNINVATDHFAYGNSSLKYDQTTPAAGQMHIMRYDPASVFDIGEWKKQLWIRSTHDHDDNWDAATIYIVDSGTDFAWWTVKFNANTWTEIELDRFNPGGVSGTVDYNQINYIDFAVTQKGGNTTSFTLWLDMFNSYDDPAADGNYSQIKYDVPYFTIEGCQLVKRGGRDTCRWDYTLRLKRVRPPPR